MRLAYLLGVFPSTRETFVSNEIIDLARRGVDVEVFSWSLPTGEVVHPEVRESGILARVHYFRYRELPRVLGRCRFWRALAAVTLGKHRRHFPGGRDKLEAAYFAALLRAQRRQHIHVHFLQTGKYLADLAGLSYSFTAHCFNENGMSEADKARYAEEVARLPFIATPSRFVQQGIQGLLAAEERDKVKLVRLGLDLERFRPGPAEGDCDVLCVAGFHASKGIEYLIRATAILRAQQPEVRVVSIGGALPGRPETETRLREVRARCGVEENFEFMGPRDSDTVRAMLGRSKVFALPAIVDDEGQSEGLPIALLEAAACGLPLVATAVAGIPDIVVDGVTGIIVPQRDPAALAAAIGRLLADPELRRRLGRAARELAEREFGREVSGQRMVEAFAAAVGEPHPLPPLLAGEGVAEEPR
jgi:glycosyltransferase involved in cell wall biosynthesis